MYQLTVFVLWAGPENTLFTNKIRNVLVRGAPASLNNFASFSRRPGLTVGFFIAMGMTGPQHKKAGGGINSQKQCGYNHHNGVVPRGLISELWRC